MILDDWPWVSCRRLELRCAGELSRAPVGPVTEARRARQRVHEGGFVRLRGPPRLQSPFEKAEVSHGVAEERKPPHEEIVPRCAGCWRVIFLLADRELLDDVADRKIESYSVTRSAPVLWTRSDGNEGKQPRTEPKLSERFAGRRLLQSTLDDVQSCRFELLHHDQRRVAGDEALSEEKSEGQLARPFGSTDRTRLLHLLDPSDHSRVVCHAPSRPVDFESSVCRLDLQKAEIGADRLIELVAQYTLVVGNLHRVGLGDEVGESGEVL